MVKTRLQMLSRNLSMHSSRDKANELQKGQYFPKLVGQNYTFILLINLGKHC